ncbi:MAG: hypothetical protein IIC91_02745 [Chloroflexi bacterium]|nr:hypothetical protein [Chloroflexota bacterium]
MAGAKLPTRAMSESRPSFFALIEKFADSWLVLAGILLLTFGVYARTLDGWFRADDFWLLQSARDTGLGRFILEAFDFRDTDPVPQFPFYRPLYVISFKIAHGLFGLNAMAYHALSVSLHLGSVTLVWFIMRRFISLPIASAAATAIFALHPAYAGTVTWIARGNMLMATFVYLVTFLLFLKYTDGGRYQRAWYAASVIGFAAAVLYHPITVTLVVVLPAVVFLAKGRPEEAVRPRSWLPFVPFILIAIAITVLQVWVRREYGVDQVFGFGWHQYTRYGEYLGIAALPILRRDWADLHLVNPEYQQMVQGLASVLMIAIGLFLLDRRRWPYVGVFAVLWLFTSLAPNSTAVVWAAIPAQLYLPGVSLGLFLVLAGQLIWGSITPALSERAKHVALGCVGAGAFVVVGLMIFGTVVHQGHTLDDSHENERFIAQLQEEVQGLEPGGTLYILNPPFNLRVFSIDALVSAVNLYLGEFEVFLIKPGEADELQATLGPNEAIFRHRP